MKLGFSNYRLSRENLHIVRLIFFIFSVLLAGRVFVINFISDSDFLGNYFILFSYALPISFLIGGASEVKLISKFSHDDDISRECDYICFQNSLIYITFPFFICFSFVFDLKIFLVLAIALGNLSMVSTLALARVQNEFELLKATIVRLVCVMPSCAIGSYFQVSEIIAFGDYLTSLIIFQFIFNKKLYFTVPRNLSHFNYFSVSYALNSVVQGLDKIILGYFSSMAVGYLVFIQAFSGYGSFLCGLFTNTFYTTQPKKLKSLSLALLFFSFALSVFGYLLFKLFGFDWYVGFTLFAIFILSAVNFIEYQSNLLGRPSMIIFQAILHVFIFFISVSILGYNTLNKILIAVFISSIFKYLHFFLRLN